jgi:hypothetical protein
VFDCGVMDLHAQEMVVLRQQKGVRVMKLQCIF